MFLGMQDFDFAEIQSLLPKLSFNFVQILSQFSQISPIITKFVQI